MTSGLIDWQLVGFSALWILGLSVLLATFSYADYMAHTEGARTREMLRRRPYPAAMYAGLTLFGLGLAGATNTWWENALWIIVALAFAFLTWRSWRAE